MITFSVIMIVVITALILFLPERLTILKLSLYMILAGAVGNLIDRAYYGYVRDFLWMVFPGATCNVADIFIVAGTVLAIIDLLFFKEWAAFTLTKKSRAIQAEKRKKEEEAKAVKIDLPRQEEQSLKENPADSDNSSQNDKVE